MRFVQFCAGTLARSAPPRPIYHRRFGRPLACAALAAIAVAVSATAAGAKNLIVEGAGFGHGVGMSQWGAYGYAEHGYTADEILAHYYTGTAIGTVSPSAKIKVLVGRRVLTLPIETYVRGVVAAEMPSTWPAAALEAQAIASRTYALTTDAGGSRFDVYSDTRSQVYEGSRAETPASNAAIAATAGQVVTYDGTPVTTYFFAASGGMTEDVQNSFIGATPEPWLRGVIDAYESPANRWKVTFSFRRAQQLLAGYVRGSLRGIEVVRRGYSPRIVLAEVLGSRGDTPITGPELEWRLGLMSAWAHFFVQNGRRISREPDISGWRASGSARRRRRRREAPAASDGGVSAPRS